MYYSQAIYCALRGKSTKFGIVIVLGLLNNISYGPQSGGGGNSLYSGGWVVAVSKLTAVIEKKAAKLSRSCLINKAWCPKKV